MALPAFNPTDSPLLAPTSTDVANKANIHLEVHTKEQARLAQLTTVLQSLLTALPTDFVQSAGFAELVQDALASALTGVNGVNVVYDDTNNKFNVGLAEQIPELLQGTGIIVTEDEADGTFTIAVGNLDAAKIVTGVLAPERLASGTPSSTSILYGNGEWKVPVPSVKSINGLQPDGAGNVVVTYPGAGTGFVVLCDTPTGYKALDAAGQPTGAVVSAAAAGTAYCFKGLRALPFTRPQDLWIKQDQGLASAVVVLTEISADLFDTGKNLSTPAAVALDTTRWGGDTSFFRQSSDGLFVPTGWGSTARDYMVFDKNPAQTGKMKAKIKLTQYSGNTTQRTLRIQLNCSASTKTGLDYDGYSIVMDTTSGGATENWGISRKENGATTATIGTESRTRVAAPRVVEIESNGTGGIKITVDGVALNSGNFFQDPSATPLTGKYAGLGGYCQSGQAAQSMNIKGDEWVLQG